MFCVSKPHCYIKNLGVTDNEAFKQQVEAMDGANAIEHCYAAADPTNTTTEVRVYYFNEYFLNNIYCMV